MAIKWFFLVVLLMLSAFFSSAETALITVNKLRIRTLADEGNKRAVTLMKIIENSSKMLSAVLIGNNIVNISASSLMTSLVIELWGSAAVGIATGLLTLFVLLFGEITPKNLATLYADEIALAYGGIIYTLMNILTPVIKVVDVLAGSIMRLLRIDVEKNAPAFTETELRTIMDVSHEDGVIESEERQMINNVFDFGDSVAKDIMIPRIHMTCADINISYDELYAIFKEEKYSRIPVYEGTTDNIVGIVNIRDFLFVEDKASFTIPDIMREAYYTYEYKKTSELMVEIREKSVALALVLDEYGATVGMITLEDLLEEIVGEIRDEYDEDEEELIRQVAELEYLVAGSMKLDDINDALGLELKSEDYDSIGGLIIGLLDRLPEPGDRVATESGILLEVAAIEKKRIDMVHMYLPEPDCYPDEDSISALTSEKGSKEVHHES